MIRRSLLPARRYLLDRMVLRPSRHAIEHPTQDREWIQFDGRKLECFVQRNFDVGETPDLCVLKFPGTAGRAERSTGFPMDLVSNLRVEVWTWNPPGYGGSEGRAGLQAIADAAVAYWNHVAKPRCQTGTKIWLCGNSLGCVSALHVAATVQPDVASNGMILRNPPPLIPVVQRVAQGYPLGRFFDPVIESLCDSMNAMHTAERVKLPAVFLQSALDTLVTPEDQNRLIRAYSGPSKLVVLEGLEHGCIATDEHAPLIKSAIEWLLSVSSSEIDPAGTIDD